MRDDAVIHRRCWALLQIALLGATAALATTHAGPRPLVEQIEPRSLPSLVVEWEWTGTVDQWHLDDGVVYMVGGGLLSALDADTGEEIWAYELAQQCSCSKLAVLDGRVAAGIDGRAILVDRASGALVADVALGDSIRFLVAEPLVFAFEGALGQELIVRLDEVSGVEVGRYSAPGDIRQVVAVDGRLVAKVEPGDGTAAIVGLNDSLHEAWRRPLPDNSYLERDEAGLFVETRGQGGHTRSTLDPETGDLRRLPPAAEAGERSFDVRVRSLGGGLVQVIRGGVPPRLVLTGGSGAEPRWQTDLPVEVDSATTWKDRLVLLDRSSGGRGILLLVDPADGSILRRVAGLRRMSELEVHGDLLLAETAAGMAAVRLDRFGPSEASSMTVAQTVRSILARLRGDDPALEPYVVHSELEALGRAALPYLTEEIPAGSAEVVEMIASLIARQPYAPAAAPFAARVEQALAVPADAAEPDLPSDSYLIHLARALAATAGPAQVPTLERLIEPESGLASGRMPLLAALGRLAPQRALEVVGRLRARFAPEGGWFEPPPAAPWVEIARQEPASGDLDREQAAEQLERLALRPTCALAEATSGGWVVFPSAAFGLLDLWTAPVDGAGVAGGALFLGPHPQLGDPDAAEESFLEAHLTAGGLEVGVPGGAILAAEIAELASDRDGDGLTDRFEAHLGLDPRNADSDGDGVEDALDRAPNGGKTAPSREEAAFLALHEIQALLADADLEGFEADPSAVDLWNGPDHRFLNDAPPLEWRAGRRATFRVAGRVSFDCQTGGYRIASPPPRPLEPDELAVEQFLECPPEYGTDRGFSFVLRDTRGGWVLSGIGH